MTSFASFFIYKVQGYSINKEAVYESYKDSDIVKREI